jgi:hypothetical protein
MRSDIMDKNKVNNMDEHYHQVLHERAEEKLDAILEYVKDIPAMKSDIRWLKADMREVKFDVEVLKIDVAELKTDMQDVKGRLGHIETSLMPS